MVDPTKKQEMMPFTPREIGKSQAITSASLLDISACNHLMDLAKLISQSDLIPVQFKGNVPNTFVALQFACSTPFENKLGILQNMYVIGGRPAIEAKLAIAMLNRSGLIRGPIHYEHVGKGAERYCTASVVDAATGRTISHTLHWRTVESAGWVAKNGSQWKLDPLLMLKYRAATQLIRTTYPEVLLGIFTIDEAKDAEQSDPLTVDSKTLYSFNQDDMAEVTDRLDQQAEKEPANATDDQCPI